MSMFGVSGRPKVPVVPGPEPLPMKCSACQASREDGALLIFEVHEGYDLPLCFNFAACIGRYRRGASASSYAAGLRGELLTVTP